MIVDIDTDTLITSFYNLEVVLTYLITITMTMKYNDNDYYFYYSKQLKKDFLYHKKESISFILTSHIDSYCYY